MSESRFPRQRRIEQALILRKLQSYEEIKVRVVREISHAEGACGYEAALRNPDAEFWREPCTRAFKKTRASLPLYQSNLPQSPATLPPGPMDRCEAVRWRSRRQKHRALRRDAALRGRCSVFSRHHAFLSPPASSRNQARKKFCHEVQHLHLYLTRASQTWPHAYSKTQ